MALSTVSINTDKVVDKSQLSIDGRMVFGRPLTVYVVRGLRIRYAVRFGQGAECASNEGARATRGYRNPLGADGGSLGQTRGRVVRNSSHGRATYGHSVAPEQPSLLRTIDNRY